MKNADEIYQASREDLIIEAMEIWDIHSARYVTNLEMYHVLLKQKRELNIRLHTIKKSVLRDYPNIIFLKMESQEAAMSFLAALETKKIRKLIIDVQYTLHYDYCFVTVSNWVSEAMYQIKNHNNKTRFGMDPGSISPKGRLRGQASGKD